MTLAELRTDAVILACAISAGIHGALAPEHFREGTAAGVGFVASTIALAALAVVLTRRPTRTALVAAAVTFAGLIVAYTLVVATGFPVLHPEQEAVDGLALVTKAVEAAGLALAIAELGLPSLGLDLRPPKGTLT
jgi:hypothetical protein